VGEQDQQQIDTDWLTADWHDNPKPRKRHRRNLLPDAYRRLSKEEKRKVRAAAKWIHQRVSRVDWGRKMRDGPGKTAPKPVNLKDKVRPYIQGNWGSWIRKLTLASIIRHLVNDDTVYFTANPGDETLLLLDIDCHASGTLEGATQFAEYLKTRFFPDLYYEVSTHGNGVHGFVVVDKRLWKEAEYKATLKPVEEWLRRVLRQTVFDVEDVELKGTPLVVSWGRRRGEVTDVCYGDLAKMPRDWTRFSEWQSTTRLTPHDLRRLPERFPVAEAEEAKPEAKAPVVRKGSVSGKLVDPEAIPKLESLAKDLLALRSPEVSASSRAVIVAEDVQVMLAVLRTCTLHRNADGTLPTKRIRALWDAAYAAGDTTRAFCWHRYKAIRDMLADLGLLEWEDNTYQFGRACKWSASEVLMGRIEESLDTTTPCDPCTVDRNKVADAIAEACRNRPEQVGLRPRMVYPSLLRVDWDAKLAEAGLEFLARQAA
jgi:hypothetical protein